MIEKPRALGMFRLSVGNENQTGEETQRTRISKRADAEEMELVDFAVETSTCRRRSHHGCARPWGNESAHVIAVERHVGEALEGVDVL
ncbi:hypothetical protein [Streptomyces sp. NPDC005336]|uniref:hypothetical protein n=1 Tax=Streptomyces sp. NPDC005336 TaxID=3157035 RepID=UPI0033A7A5D8